MNISAKMIFKQLEESMISAKNTFDQGKNENFSEELIRIKTYCDILLEAQKQIKAPTELENSEMQMKVSPTKKENIMVDEANSDSLFDF